MKLVITDQPEYVGKWVAARSESRYREGDTAIGLLDPEKGLIAGVLYQNFNGVNISAHIAAEPGATWLNRAFLWTIFDYPFRQLGVKRITGLVPDANSAAKAFDEHLGFVEEARIDGALPSGDLIIYRMREQDCRWLRSLDGRYGRHHG